MAVTLNTPYNYADPDATLKVTNGELAVADDVNNVWGETDVIFSDITTDMTAVASQAEEAEHWATDPQGTEPDSVNNPDEYSALAYAEEAEGWATSLTTIPKADGTTDSSGSSLYWAGVSESSAATAQASANFDGTWSAGTYTAPSSVYYNGNYWVLDATSTTGEPGVSSDWLILSQGNNKNLLVNTGFTFNQEVYEGDDPISTGEYGQDMWKAGDAVTQWTVSSGVVTMISGRIWQQNDDMIANSGNTVTFSVVSGSCTIEGCGVSGTEVVTPSTPHTFISDGTGLYVGSGTEVFSGPKLEIGSVATTYEVPSIHELSLSCYRYYYRMSAGFHSASAAHNGASTTTASCGVAIPCEMSSVPAITLSNITLTGGGVQKTAVTSTASSIENTGNTISMTINGFTGLTPYYSYSLYVTGAMIFDARY